MFDRKRHAHYMLRRGLMLSRAQEIIDETTEFCRQYSIGEVIWKCDAEAFNHGLTPLPIVHNYVDILQLARTKLQACGINHSINPWVTLNWSDRGRCQRDIHHNFEWRVDIDGRQCVACACLRGQNWRHYLCEAYSLYATTKPSTLWLEDDYKTFLFGGGCFCESCLAEFSRRIDENLDRQSLLSRILAPGRPDPLRAEWIDFLAEEMVETCRRLEEAVHAESPQTQIGLMGSWSADGRWWGEAVKALAGPLQPLSRPSLAPYEEVRATEFALDNFDIVKEIKCFGAQTRQCPELENSTYTPFSKSVRMTRLQMGLSQFLGNNDITMNLFDMVGTSIWDDIRVGPMLRDTKPFLDTLASACGPGGADQGVGMVWDKRMADRIPLRQGEGIAGLRTDGEGWALPIQGAGIPVIWQDSPTVAVTGRILHALDDSAIHKLLGGGLLLDGSAAETLDQMGYGQFVGVSPVEKFSRYDTLLSAEEFFVPDFGGRPQLYIDTRRFGERNQFYRLELKNGAREISRYVDPDDKPVLPAWTVYENSLGGRVAVHAFDLSEKPTVSFMNWNRKYQLTSILRWLGRGRVDLQVNGGAWMVPIRRDYDDYVLIGVLNYETDDWEYLEVIMAWGCENPPQKIQIAYNSLGWQDIEPAETMIVDGHLRLRFDQELVALDFLALAVSKD